MRYIKIEKDLIPYTFNITLYYEVFEFRIDYNVTADLFTVALFKDGVELCAGEPIIYGVPLFGDLLTRGNFPLVVICPIDESYETTAVTYDNFSSTVLLCVDSGDEDE